MRSRAGGSSMDRNDSQESTPRPNLPLPRKAWTSGEICNARNIIEAEDTNTKNEKMIGPRCGSETHINLLESQKFQASTALPWKLVEKPAPTKTEIGKCS